MRDRFVDASGVRLRARLSGTHLPGTPALVLHGFTGSVESMSEVVDALATVRPVVALDLVGHGQSDAPESPAAYTMQACVEQVAAALDALGCARVHTVGYSMGGRVALSLCVAQPDRVASLLLVGASPGISDPDQRAARVAADHALASQIQREGLANFVEYWMGLPLFATQRSLGPEGLERARRLRLRCRPVGLIGSLRGMGTGAMPPLHEHLKDIAQPVCLVAGSLDEKFARLAGEMETQFPNARRALIEGVGHAVHLEAPERFAHLARSFHGAGEFHRAGALPAPT